MKRVTGIGGDVRDGETNAPSRRDPSTRTKIANRQSKIGLGGEGFEPPTLSV